MFVVRQGDVLIEQVEALPPGEAEAVARDCGRLVLAYGEVTGHAHAVAAPGVQLVRLFQEHYLVADAPFQVVHEEHATVDVPAGVFRVVRQRQYFPDAIRPIAD